LRCITARQERPAGLLRGLELRRVGIDAAHTVGETPLPFETGSAKSAIPCERMHSEFQENAERLLEQRRGKLAGAGAEPGGSSFLQALFADWYFVEVMSIPVILNASVLDGPRVGSGNAGSPCERKHCA
jgi:hypothetical protein